MRIQMKKSFLRVTSLIVLSMALYSAPSVFAQGGPVTGGYAAASISDAEVVAAARYAVRAQRRKQSAVISLISIRSAEVQVVAGLNYRLGLRVKVNGKTLDVTAVVYKNLRRRYSLSSWETDRDSTGGASAALSSTIEELVESLSEAYTSKTLDGLDKERPLLGRVRIVIEHSLAGDDDKDRFEIKTFTTFKQAEQWLRSRERDEGFPARQSKPLVRCRQGVCTYNFDGGILHNNLYLQKISYDYRRGRPFIKTIYLLDGD